MRKMVSDRVDKKGFHHTEFSSDGFEDYDARCPRCKSEDIDSAIWSWFICMNCKLEFEMVETAIWKDGK